MDRTPAFHVGNTGFNSRTGYLRFWVKNDDQEVNRLDEEPVLKTGGDINRLWVQVPRLPLSGDTQSEQYEPGIREYGVV